MEQYVDRIARITALSPPDAQGCLVVRVDVDRGARPWRARDLMLLDEATSSSSPAARSGGDEEESSIPQECGQSEDDIRYGPIRTGVRVILGRHRPVDGQANWSDEMGTFVGQVATVTRHSGADGAGCPGVRVDADEGEHFWRIRDLRLFE